MFKLILSIFLINISYAVIAKADTDRQLLLTTELPPFGAIRAGNGDTIPAWIDAPVIEDNMPLFTITAANHQQY